MPKTTHEWQKELEESLNVSEKDVLRRNVAITAHYARWYLDPQGVFKWAGAAAFASDRVGVILLLHQVFATDRIRQSVANLLGGAKDEEAGPLDLDLIRQTNNAVFADIGWAHRAYSSGYDLSVIEAALSGNAGYERMLEGFRTIDHGLRLRDSSPSQAEELIWQGNSCLLQHEQFVTVQGYFNQMRQPLFKQFLSQQIDLDFDADNAQIDPNTYTAFQKYTLPQLPDITDLDQRWRWAQEVFRIWRRVEATDKRLRKKMEDFIKKAALM